MKKLMVVALLGAIASGCVSKFKNDGGDADLRPAIVRDIAYEKYDISNKTVSSTDHRIGLGLPFFETRIVVGGLAGHFADNVDQGWSKYQTARMAKNGAYAAACEAAKCDSLVGTRYDVKYTNYFLWDEATVTVVGYPAKLTGVEFRPASVSK